MPVVYKNEIRPLETSARLWFQEVYHQDVLIPEHRLLLNLSKGSALEFFWKMHLFEDEHLRSLPLFWIGDEELKQILGFNPTVKRFTFADLKEVFEDTLQSNLKVVEHLILDAFIKIAGNTTLTPGEKVLLRIVNADIQCEFVEKKLLVTHAPSIVPWHYLSALCFSSSYAIRLPIGRLPNPGARKLQSLLHNFLQYKNLLLSKNVIDSLFTSPFNSDLSYPSRTLSYLHSRIFSSNFNQLTASRIAFAIAQFFYEYEDILQKNGHLYPSQLQLKAENLLTGFRLWFPISALYCLGIILAVRLITFQETSLLFKTLTCVFLLSAFLLHSYVLLLKSLAIASFPIASLFDLGFFATWLAALFGFFIFLIFKKKGFLLSAAFASALLFMLLPVYGSNEVVLSGYSLSNGEWSGLHTVITSLGFILLMISSVVAHVALWTRKKKTIFFQNCLYAGTFCIGIGILTGSLWTSSGTNRFLECDSQECWAVFTICFYSLLIYLNNFKWFENTGFSLGGCLGVILLGWGWKKNPLFFLSGIDFFSPEFILLELFFITAIGIQRAWALSSKEKGTDHRT